MDITSLQDRICAIMHSVCSVIHRKSVTMYRVCGIIHRIYPVMHYVCSPMRHVRSVGHHACSFRHGVPFVSRSAPIDCITLKLIRAVCRTEQANSDFMSRVWSRVRSTGNDQNYVHNTIHQSNFNDPTSLIKAMIEVLRSVSGIQTAWARSWQLTP